MLLLLLQRYQQLIFPAVSHIQDFGDATTSPAGDAASPAGDAASPAGDAGVGVGDAHL